MLVGEGDMVVSLYLLLEIFAFILCLHYLYEEDIHINLKLLLIIAIDIVWIQSVYTLGWNRNLTFVMYPLLVVYCLLQFGYNFKAILVNNVLTVVILCIIQSTIAVFLSLLFETYTESIMVLCNVLVIGIIVGLNKIIKFSKLSKILQSKDRLIIVVLSVVIVSLLIFLVNYKSQTGFELMYYIVFGISVVLIGFTAVDIGRHRIKIKEAEAELRLHRLYEASFCNLIDEICFKQHEFDNHINVIFSQHFTCSSYEELVEVQSKYCSMILEENRFNKLLSKGNPLILGFLYGKFIEAEKKGIEVEYKVSIKDLITDIPIYRIVEIIGNLLKNAVEELENSEKNNRMYFRMIENEEAICITVGNECTEIMYDDIQKFFRKGYSKKGDRRGIGLYNVRRICEEYNIEIYCDNKMYNNINWLIFKVKILKPL